MPNLLQASKALPAELSSWAERHSNLAAGEVQRVLRLPETERLTGYSKMQLWRMEKAGHFPKRFKLNPDGGRFGAVGHDLGEVQAWLAARRASRAPAA